MCASTFSACAEERQRNRCCLSAKKFCDLQSVPCGDYCACWRKRCVKHWLIYWTLIYSCMITFNSLSRIRWPRFQNMIAVIYTEDFPASILLNYIYSCKDIFEHYNFQENKSEKLKMKMIKKKLKWAFYPILRSRGEYDFNNSLFSRK